MRSTSCRPHASATRKFSGTFTTSWLWNLGHVSEDDNDLISSGRRAGKTAKTVQAVNTSAIADITDDVITSIG